jgi:hypothetical protein
MTVNKNNALNSGPLGGVSTLTSHGIVLGNGTSVITATNELSDGQILVGSTGNTPVPTTITAGSNVTVTNAPGSITIAASSGGAGLSWQVISGTSQLMVPNTGYLTTYNGLCTFTLPTSCNIGDMFGILTRVTTNTASTWKVAPTSTQKLLLANWTATGPTNYLGTGTTPGASYGIIFMCTDNTSGAQIFQCLNAIGVIDASYDA